MLVGGWEIAVQVFREGLGTRGIIARGWQLTVETLGRRCPGRPRWVWIRLGSAVR